MVRRQELQLGKISRFEEDGESFSNATTNNEERENVCKLLNLKTTSEEQKSEKSIDSIYPFEMKLQDATYNCDVQETIDSSWKHENISSDVSY
jgi:hypothetical protein